MEHIQNITWQAFKTILQDHSQKHLQFEYEKDKRVRGGYHLTEIKLAPITSVDCGGKVNNWTEVILQLWESSDTNDTVAMPAQKALSIIAIVEQSITIDPTAIVKIEYGNDHFAMRQMQPADIDFTENDINISLVSGQTECKAIGRGETCGTPKKKIELSTLTDNNTNCCTPESGCCQ